jgi:hypothetical protein
MAIGSLPTPPTGKVVKEWLMSFNQLVVALLPSPQHDCQTHSTSSLFNEGWKYLHKGSGFGPRLDRLDIANCLWYQ